MTLGTDPDRLKNQFAAAGAREFVGSGNALEARSQYLASVIADDKDGPILLSASQQSKRETQLSETRKRRREEQQRLVLTLAEQARRLSEQLGKQIAAMETAFEAEMGDAWREQIANKVMDADDIPQRREGESMKDYRDRLEIVLITTMIDPETGDIKPEFADNPETARYAQWAQAEHQKRNVDAYLGERSNLAFTHDDRLECDEAFSRSATYQALQQARAANIRSDTATGELSEAIDTERDALASQTSNENAAFKI